MQNYRWTRDGIALLTIITSPNLDQLFSHFSEILCWDQLDLEVILHFFDNFMTFQAYN